MVEEKVYSKFKGCFLGVRVSMSVTLGRYSSLKFLLLTSPQYEGIKIYVH